MPFKKLCTRLLFGWVEGFQKLKTADLFQESTYYFKCYFDHDKKGEWRMAVSYKNRIRETLKRTYMYVQTLEEAEEHNASSQ